MRRRGPRGRAVAIHSHTWPSFRGGWAVSSRVAGGIMCPPQLTCAGPRRAVSTRPVAPRSKTEQTRPGARDNPTARRPTSPGGTWRRAADGRLPIRRDCATWARVGACTRERCRSGLISQDPARGGAARRAARQRPPPDTSCQRRHAMAAGLRVARNLRLRTLASAVTCVREALGTGRGLLFGSTTRAPRLAKTRGPGRHTGARVALDRAEARAGCRRSGRRAARHHAPVPQQALARGFRH